MPSLRHLLIAATALSSAKAWKTCTVPFGGQGVDDAAAVRSLLPNCSSDAEFVFNSCTRYNISTPIDFGHLTNVAIRILGDLELPKDIPYVQSLVNATTGQRLYWFTATGDNVTLAGNPDPNWGHVNSYGEQWWTAAQYVYPLGGLPLRPHGWSLSLNNSVIEDMKIVKPIGWSFSLKGNNNVVRNINLDASYDLSTPKKFPFNTDAFDIGMTNSIIENSYIFNGDDCVAVNAGTHNLTVRGLTCVGGHGISLSATDNVSNVLFQNCTSRDSLYGTRFKSSLNSVGNVSNVTWDTIYIQNATFPIFATSVYFDQNTNRGRTPGVYPANSNATKISNFTWKNIYGTINDVNPGDGSCTTDPCWYHVANATNNAGVTLQLLDNSATNLHMENIQLFPIDGKGGVDVVCSPSSFTDGTGNLGIQCANGPIQVQ